MVDNTSITHWQQFTALQQGKRWRLMKYNDALHLYDIGSPARIPWGQLSNAPASDDDRPSVQFNLNNRLPIVFSYIPRWESTFRSRGANESLYPLAGANTQKAKNIPLGTSGGFHFFDEYFYRLHMKLRNGVQAETFDQHRSS